VVRHRVRSQIAERGRPFIAAFVLVGLVACSPGASGPVGTAELGSAEATSASSAWPVSPEPLPDATSPGDGSGLTCGGRIFPASGLTAPATALAAAGPEFDALRATLVGAATAFPAADKAMWRLAGRDSEGAIFLAEIPAGSNQWLSVEVTAAPGPWSPGSIGECTIHAVLSADYGPASWALNPAFPAPGPGSTALEILVWEQACSSGAPVSGRMSAPVIDYGGSTVTITIGVRPLEGAQTCPLGPGTPASLLLAGPLGARTLLDGGTVPPRPPSPPGSQAAPLPGQPTLGRLARAASSGVYS
jgi:hypothetical protein